MISDKKPVQDLTELLKAHQVNDIVISPGSRNAPLSISFHSDPDFNCYSIVDERSAGFFALGIAQQTRKPVVLLSTSGSAAANYFPAVTEACYQQIPLIVITADRPLEWVNQGEGQTIVQRGLYGSHVRYEANVIQEATQKDLVWYNQRIINAALRSSKHPIPGPVHINIPFRENLYGTISENQAEVKIDRKIESQFMLSNELKEEISENLQKSPRILVLTGILQPNLKLNDSISKFAKNTNALVLTETTSNLSSEKFIAGIDRLIMTFDEEDKEDFQPDLLITVGHSIISKKIKSQLRTHKAKNHWHIGTAVEAPDTFQSLTIHIPTDPLSFFNQIQELQTPHTGYAEKWLSRFNSGISAHDSYLSTCEFSDLKAFDIILEKVPEKFQIQMGNSSIVRYIQLFEQRKDLQFFGNRGTSGIDGCSSTAVGASLASQNPTLLISGDLAFMYDINAFWNVYVPSHLKVIVINNGGGGIFRIIEGPSSTPALEEHFEVSHSRNVSKLADHYGLSYKTAHNSEELETNLEWLFSEKDTALLEIFTPREHNDSILKDYFRFLKKNN